MEEPLPPELQNLEYNKPDDMLAFAFDIKKGRAGGDYFYSLEEDYIYVYEDNYWKKLLEKEFQDRIERSMGILTTLPLRKRKEVIENFKVKKHLKIDKLNQTHLINFKNCMFDPITFKEIPHSKEDYSTIRIPYNYNPEACCLLWLKTLNEIFENDINKIDSLQEYFGYCLVKDTTQIMSLLLQGESKSGKSTILYILRHLVGLENCSSVEMKNISNAQYTPMLINKLINIDADVSEHAKDFEAEFKKITSGEPINCNQKFVPTFPFTPYCKIVIAANRFPRITDHSSAFYNRLLIIPCNRIFLPSEQDRTLKHRLLEELPGIFNWAIEGLKKLNQRGLFDIKDFSHEAIEELENENNPSNLFFEEHIEISMGAETEKGELFERYKKWAGTNENWVLNSAKFSMAVYKKYKAQTPKKAQSVSTRKRVWRNIKYVDFKHDIEFKNVVEEEE